ncbi:unnamed protein product, partial [Staurois parvus]
MSVLQLSNFPPVPSPYVLERNPEDRCRHPLEDIAGVQDKVSEEEITEQHCKVFPSVAQGYRLCYTREYLQGG